jgi:hypothetical protein
MPGKLTTTAIDKISRRIPGLRRLPVLKLFALAEIAIIARDHIERLEPYERRRLVELLRDGRGRPSNLSPSERHELENLVAKAEPRLFAGEVADKLSPVPLPKRIIRGPKHDA